MTVINFKELKNKWKASGDIPEWYSSNSLQFFMNKYSFEGESVKSRDTAIAKYLAENSPNVYPDWWEQDEYTKGKTWFEVYFNLIFKDGFAVCSTPLKANGGLPERGMTVSCSRQHLSNNIASKYLNNAETAIFTKFAHGTAITIDDWLHEGAEIGEGDFSEGIMPIVEMVNTTTSAVTQG